MKSKLLFVFILFAMCLAAFPAFAQSAPTVNPCENLAEATRGKNYTEVATILDACRKGTTSVSAAIAEKLPDSEEVTGWSQAAKGFAEALGVAAKQLGIAVNDFLNSPAGILLAVILLFNYAGGAIVGLPFTMFSLWLLWTLARRYSVESVEYENVPVFWGFSTMRRKRLVKMGEISDTGQIVLVIGAIGLLILNITVWCCVT